MNFFLYINRKIIFFLGASILILFFIIIFSKKINFNNSEFKILDNNLPNIDITEPKFAINNKSEKIYITAKQGNFLNKEEVLLKNNVRFKSNDFSIETEKVIFNRNNQTAHSETKSLFKSQNTTISSYGFDIHDQGNKIIFYGKSLIVLK